MPEDEAVSESRLEEQGGYTGDDSDFDELNASEGGDICSGKGNSNVREANNAEILRTNLDNVRIICEETEDGAGKDGGGDGEDDGDEGCGEDAHPQHFADGFDLTFAPKLGREDRHAAGESEKQKDEDEEELVR